PAALAGVVPRGVQDHGGEDVGGVDAAVAVDVGDLEGPLVARVVEVVERDQAVAVDVDQVGLAREGDLGLVDPDVAGKVRVVVVDPGVDYRDDDLTRPLGDIPGLGGVDVGAGGAAVLTGVLHVPLLAEARVVGDLADGVEEVRRGQLHARVG